MELVKGTPITKYCDERRLTVRDRLELFADVCRQAEQTCFRWKKRRNSTLGSA